MKIANDFAIALLGVLLVQGSLVSSANANPAEYDETLASYEVDTRDGLAVTAACRDPGRNKAREEVCMIVNSERKDRKVSGLKLDATLNRVAQGHAEDMRRKGYFGHDSPSGSTMVTRLKAAGAKYGWAGENIAQGQAQSEEVVEDWMNSKGHRKNILNGRFKKLGVGRSGNIWVQVFTD